MSETIITNFSSEYLNLLKMNFNKSHKIKINNFFKDDFANSLFNYCNSLHKNTWTLATGINEVKYEKKLIYKFDRVNNLQINNVNNAFGEDKFTYIFYRSMNNNLDISFMEFSLRKTLNSPYFIDLLNSITGLNLTKLTTMFLSKYTSGSFLSPHSDRGNGRLAFVINISKNWKPQYGGNLHFLNDDRTEILETFVPQFNSLMIFYVPENIGIPHFVSHIAPNVKHARYAVTGWFD
jgi:Rps23 Pro-64 3,4-dihydroxylase Tpa1-like proline 4-hydroxylase